MASKLIQQPPIGIDTSVVPTVVRARVDFLASLGLVPTDFTANSHVMATRNRDRAQRRHHCARCLDRGNDNEPMAQVVNAAAGGLAAASAIIGEIITGQTNSRSFVQREATVGGCYRRERHA